MKLREALWSAPLGCVWTQLALTLKYSKAHVHPQEGGAGRYTGYSDAESKASIGPLAEGILWGNK